MSTVHLITNWMATRWKLHICKENLLLSCKILVMPSDTQFISCGCQVKNFTLWKNFNGINLHITICHFNAEQTVLQLNCPNWMVTFHATLLCWCRMNQLRLMWLPLWYVLAFKSMTGQVPNYLSSNFISRGNISGRATRSSTQLIAYKVL